MEGIHGEAKCQHGLRRAVRRGLSNVRIQAYLTAVVINLKRLAALDWSVDDVPFSDHRGIWTRVALGPPL